jgi:hypothetical protein
MEQADHLGWAGVLPHDHGVGAFETLKAPTSKPPPDAPSWTVVTLQTLKAPFYPRSWRSYE